MEMLYPIGENVTRWKEDKEQFCQLVLFLASGKSLEQAIEGVKN